MAFVVNLRHIKFKRMPVFSHLHVHTQYSLLDGASDIKKLIKKAVDDGMPAIAITDHGNMFGVFDFVAEANKYNTKDKKVIKPIVGCEFYLVENRFEKQFTREKKDQRFHQLLLAKNEEGYHNLSKLCSLGYIEGLYGKYPRIDKELLLKYHKGLIATSCCLAAEIPRTILRQGEKEAEEKLKWWIDLFGDDYYIELQRHQIPDQEKVNAVLLKFAKKYNIKIIASNDTHYIDKEDARIHDIMLCINTGERLSTPKMKEFTDDDEYQKGKRFAFYNDEFYLKTQEEMNNLFNDLPEAIDNTNEIVDKVDFLSLEKDIILPVFPIPDEFKVHEDNNLNQWEYLKHITYEGARKRYGEITPEIEERINFELFTIKSMGFAGYFLIVWDFIKKGREMGVFIGPGRGSAAGSVVAYCIGITNIDPIKYGLLFERFLNPDRKSMPDIDTDFDDEGRQKVIDYVIKKYGENQVAQIITYSTMAPKMSVRDVARVYDLPLSESDALAKLIPAKPGITFQSILHAPLEGEDSLSDSNREGLRGDEIENIKLLRQYYAGDDLKAKVLQDAEKLEGTIRGTGVHAAGVLIAPTDIMDIIPVCTAKDSNLRVSQFDGSIIESAGIIKMDFLGLKNLTIIRDTLKLIKQNRGIEIDLDNLPLDDKETFEIFQRGETNGIFQFESDGMKKNLMELKPDKFEDLIAMNALYRPGPMKYIEHFIKRKHGLEEITYDLPEMKEYLEETYGITVYQEQVMLLAQKLAGFTKGEADTLRKAMGKKQKSVLDNLKGKFLENGQKNGYPIETLEKIWSDWEDFAKYAFNKSHSTCYAMLAYQTAYLKAHYPNEYMAAVLTHNLNIDKIGFFIEECQRMMIPLLGPDINESEIHFSVNQNGEIRYGLAAIKGVGEAVVEAIIEERSKNGPFKSIFDLCKRMQGNKINKRVIESLAYAGALDCFGLDRAQYFYKADENDQTLIEKALQFASKLQPNQTVALPTLFGEEIMEENLQEPEIPQCEPWSNLTRLNYEKEYIGFYLTGHPLDRYKFFINQKIKDDIVKLKEFLAAAPINDAERKRSYEFQLAGLITHVEHRTNKNDMPYGRFVIEDYKDKHEFSLFSETYLKFKHLLDLGLMVYMTVEVRFYQGSLQPRVYVKHMELLEKLPELTCQKFYMGIKLKDIDRELNDKISEIIRQHKGSQELVTVIMHKQHKFSFVSKNKVKISPDLVKDLQKLKKVELAVR